jgi:sterol desaturase/sphingolipid hydroxylase (fatty acid hydroxylase superfamily)/uncharacterized membrane protein YhhN
VSPSQIIVLATPVFILLMLAEFAWGRAKGRNTYRLNDTVTNIGLGMLSQVAAVFTPVLSIGIYTAIFSSVALWPNSSLWTTWYGWLIALVFYDFCYYWQHRAGHDISLFWAAHVVHHQSQGYNLSTALRQPSTYPLLNWIFYVPMAVAGVPPLVFGVVVLVDLLYQFWVHTEHVGKLGWFDRWFCSPSNHRVHHAVNDHYLDRNYGGILILWDRLFGTFQEEGEPCTYGTRKPVNSWNPLWANAEVYWALLQDSWHARRWSDKLKVWFKPPGWRPEDVAQRYPSPGFDIEAVKTYNPPMRQSVAVFAAVQFVMLLMGVSAFLWFYADLNASDALVWASVLCLGAWVNGVVMQGRFSIAQVILIECAALATATSAVGAMQWHFVFKPLALVIAIFYIANYSYSTGTSGTFYSHILQLKRLLLAALGLSLVGDVFLMLPGDTFIPGLASFLVAHLFYIALFRTDTRHVRWFPNRGALGSTLLAGAAMYGFVYGSLGDPVLKVAVAVYALVISLMAAQALGRATVLSTPQSKAVAIGALFFMLSDSLIAINRFVLPLPMAALAVLSTYYIAQILITFNSIPSNKTLPKKMDD